MVRNGRQYRFASFVMSALLMTVSTARAAWDGMQQIVPGDEVSAVFAAAPGTETHFFIFYAPDQASHHPLLEAGQGADPRRPGPRSRTCSRSTWRATARARRSSGFPLPTRGRHTIQVRTTGGDRPVYAST